MSEPARPAAATFLSPRTIFLAYLRLGCTSFGGPVAHLGYFREELVVRRKWLDDRTFTDIVGLCQFLPGPASSQVGFTIGLLRGGALGAFAAWTAFTLPSALLMFAVASSHALPSSHVGERVVNGLQLVAVAVIAQAVWGMMRTLTPDPARRTIAVAASAVILLSGHPASQLAAIVLGAVLGLIFCRGIAAPDSHPLRILVARPVAVAALVLFLALLVGPAAFLAFRSSHAIAFFQAFYRSGALVFGGGHVVLPLLQSATVSTGWIDNSTFLAGYGAAQALPGPLFTFAAYLGAVSGPPPHGALGAAIALVAIFLPGLLLLVGVLPFWDRLRSNQASRALFAGVNASVVGVLLAALYQPVWTSAVSRPRDFVFALAAFLALVVWKTPPWIVVASAALLGVLSGFLG
ncbi:MAG TPA: chromate efflux transporter [Candidatus Saccharimonadales bacterium]|nr:chromate efflux transporter [Candidatus Saccharimonadales bacterium]